MVSNRQEWWRRHGPTVALLLLAFGASILVRTIFAAPILTQYGPLYVYGGGSDSFYHFRVSEYIILNGHTLVHDGMLKFPVGATNPREPLFDWMNAIFGVILAPLFGGNPNVAAAFSLSIMGPIWSALSVFPVYLIGREVSSRRMGIIAALSYPFVVANIDSSVLGYANYLSFYSFFILVVVYSYIRTVKLAGTRRWVERYRDRASVRNGLRAFFRAERAAVRWAVFTGVALGTLALAWQGYPFMVAVIIVFLAFAMVVERVRKLDSFSLYILTWIMGAVAFPLAFPYYLGQGQFANWFDLPLLIYFGSLLVLLPFLLLRDFPWVVSVPVFAGAAAVGVGALAVFDPVRFQSLITGQGYFVKTLIYSTVAEAQAPSIDALILGYGVITFLLAFVGFGLFLYRMVAQRFKPEHMLFIVFAAFSIFLPISAAKFFYLGSAVYALLPAEIVILFLNVGGYPQLRRNVASLSDRRSQFVAFRRAFKARHVLVLLLVVGLLLPNIWYAIDAGIPYNSKSQYSSQVYDSLPSFLRGSSSQASSYYLGAAGVELDTPNQYDEAGYNWLAKQDANLPPVDRPAFISWWDYGFQAIAEGKHPAVADNFQDGIVPGGQFLLSQNDSAAISVLTTTLLTGEQKVSGQPNLPPALNAVLARDGVNVTTLQALLNSPVSDITMVKAHPERYLAVDPSHIDGSNAIYYTVSHFLSSSLTDEGAAQVYNDVQAFTGWSIRYAMVDSRLFPFSGQNTGIFYAPADLTDRVIGAGGAPTAYYTLSVLGSNGNVYSPSSVPPGVSIAQYLINYSSAFYNTMVYRIFAGYNGTDIGQAQGIPGVNISGNPMPGWMLPHFRVVYRTAYYCPYSDPSSHPGCFSAMNLPEVQALAKKGNGTAVTGPTNGQFGVGYYDGGEAILEYYPGVHLVGRVALADGTPVPYAHVTVFDGWGIPHMTVTTLADGSYSVLLPPGNDTLNLSVGQLNPQTMSGPIHLASVPIGVPDALGLNPASPTLVRTFTVPGAVVQGFVYWNTLNNTTYVPSGDPLISGANVNLWAHGLSAVHATTDASGAFAFLALIPGTYNFSITYQGANFTQTAVTAGPGQPQNETTGLLSGHVTGRVRYAFGPSAPGVTVTVSDGAGIRLNATTNSTGVFIIPNLPPGNFTVVASLPGTALSSSSMTATIPSPGKKASVNLTLVPQITVVLPVLDQGSPSPGILVRFAPIPTSPILSPGQTALLGVVDNSSVFTSNAQGVVVATVPVGNYSIYAYAASGSGAVAGFSSAYLPPNVAALALAPLVLGPANVLSGTATVPGGPGLTPLDVRITAFDSRGDEVVVGTNSNGSYFLPLPSGNYSILATAATPTSPQPFSLLKSVALTASLRLNLTLLPSFFLRAEVGTFIPGTVPFFPAAAAQVSVALPLTGATVTGLTNSKGNITLVVPPAIGASGSNYCLNATAVGFARYSQCGLTPTQLTGLSTVDMTLNSVQVRLHVLNLPAATSVQLNFSGQAVPARSISVNETDGATFSVEPGPYLISAWARSPTTGIYLPAGPLLLRIPLGTVDTNVTVFLLKQVIASGVLSLPSGVTADSVSVNLTAPLENMTLSGSAFASHFYSAPGSYTVRAVSNASGTPYAAWGTVHVNATGATTPTVALAPGGVLIGRLTLPNGATVNSALPVILVTANGLVLVTEASGGLFSATLPAGTVVTVLVNATVIVPTLGGGDVIQRYVSAAGSSCTVSANSLTTGCTVSVNPTLTQTTLHGHLNFAGSPITLNGTAQFFGPGPSTFARAVPVVDGSFSVALNPGSYVIVVAAGAGNVLGNVSTLFVPLRSQFNATLGLAATWQLTLSVAPPPLSQGGSATVTVRSPTRVAFTLSSVVVGPSLNLSLPPGIWNVSANASYAPYGVAANASASGNAPLVRGNFALRLALTYSFVKAVALRIAGPSPVLVPGNVTLPYSYSLRNAGNAPVTVKLAGSPAPWGFAFSPRLVNLGVGTSNATVTGTFTIHVPASESVNHPAIVIEAVDNSSGTILGTGTPLPTVNIIPYSGLALGGSPAVNQVGPYSAHLGFYVLNGGNYPESVSLVVADAARLAGLGWKSSVNQGPTPLLTPLLMGPGANESFSLVLSAPTGAALPPGYATVVGTVANTSGALTRTLIVPVPVLPLTPSQAQIVVTGPGIGSPSPYPSWFVPLLSFVPAIVLVASLSVRRWLRTRRWTRR